MQRSLLLSPVHKHRRMSTPPRPDPSTTNVNTDTSPSHTTPALSLASSSFSSPTTSSLSTPLPSSSGYIYDQAASSDVSLDYSPNRQPQASPSQNPDYLTRVSNIPIVNSALRAYEHGKASSRIVNVRPSIIFLLEFCIKLTTDSMVLELSNHLFQLFHGLSLTGWGITAGPRLLKITVAVARAAIGRCPLNEAEMRR
jgi:hypothetical protein